MSRELTWKTRLTKLFKALEIVDMTIIEILSEKRCLAVNPSSKEGTSVRTARRDS